MEQDTHTAPGRVDIFHCTLVFLAAFLVYAWSAPRTVVIGDDGLFILAAYFNGIAHPPGYPLYTLLAHFATWVPLGSVAFRVHLLSGFLGSMACVCLWCLAYILIKDRIAAYAAALSLAYSSVFWSQAIIAKGTYTLNALLILLLLLLAIHIQKPQAEHDLNIKIRWFSFCYGLALCNHWPLVILSTPMVIAILWPCLRNLQKYLYNGLPYFVIGLIPYAWMVLTSHINPDISFYGPIDSFSDFWFYLSRKGFANLDFSPSAGWQDKLDFLIFILQQTKGQYGWIGFILALTGLVYQWLLLPKNINYAFILGYLGSTLLLVLLLGFDFDIFHQAVFSAYPLIAYVVVSIWISIGLCAMTKLSIILTSKRLETKFVSLCLVSVLIGSTFTENVSANYRTTDYWAKNYAVTILNSLPKNSLLFLDDDAATGPISYFNKIEGYRQDVSVYQKKGLIFGNRIFKPLHTNSQMMKETIEKFITSKNRPIYYIGDLPHEHGVEYYGLYSKVLKNKDHSYIRVTVLPSVLEYYRYLMGQGIPLDQREKAQRNSIYFGGCKLLTIMERFSGPLENKYRDLKTIQGNICNNLLGIYTRIDLIMNLGNPDRAMLELLLKKAELHLDEAMLKTETALYYYYRGRLYLTASDNNKARTFLEMSMNVWNHPENPATKLLRDLPQ